MFEKLKEKSKKLKKEIFALYLAYKDKRVSLGARIIIIIVVAYAISPIDLIPDFIPILGYLDDLIIVPLGIMLAIKLIPKHIMEECRAQAEKKMDKLKPKKIVATIIILIWLLGLFFIINIVYRIVIGKR
jgi:uncharacterized membrane protein YkvA (DUF1232 family)